MGSALQSRSIAAECAESDTDAGTFWNGEERGIPDVAFCAVPGIPQNLFLGTRVFRVLLPISDADGFSDFEDLIPRVFRFRKSDADEDPRQGRLLSHHHEYTNVLHPLLKS